LRFPVFLVECAVFLIKVNSQLNANTTTIRKRFQNRPSLYGIN
jgi:hypothetical protein